MKDRFDDMAALIDILQVDLIAEDAATMRRYAERAAPDFEQMVSGSAERLSEIFAAWLARYGIEIRRREASRTLRLYIVKRLADGNAKGEDGGQ